MTPGPSHHPPAILRRANPDPRSRHLDSRPPPHQLISIANPIRPPAHFLHKHIIASPTVTGYLKAYPGQDASTGTGTSVFNFTGNSGSIADLGLVYTVNSNSFIISSSTGISVVLDINGYFQ